MRHAEKVRNTGTTFISLLQTQQTALLELVSFKASIRV